MQTFFHRAWGGGGGNLALYMFSLGGEKGLPVV